MGRDESGGRKMGRGCWALWNLVLFDPIEDYLYERKLHLPLLGTKPESMKAEKWALLDRQLGDNEDDSKQFYRKGKLKYNDIRDLILAEEIRRRDAGETSGSGSALNLETRGRGDFGKVYLTNGLALDVVGLGDVWISLPNGLFGYWRRKSYLEDTYQRLARGKLVHFHGWKSLALPSVGPAKTTELCILALGTFPGNLSSKELETPERAAKYFRNTKLSSLGYKVGFHLEVSSSLLAACAPKVAATTVIKNRLHGRFSLLFLLAIRIHSWQLNSKLCPRFLIALLILDLLWTCNTICWWYLEGYKGARVLACGKKTGTLYMTSCPRDTIAVADASTDTSLWHCRLGHLSEKGMKMLLSKGKLPELKSIDFDMCESCILGKQKNVSFLKTGRTSKAEKLELVHTDLWGPSSVASLVVQDNGGEYIDGRFSEYCAAQGIRMEKTIPRTHSRMVDLSTPVVEVRRSFRNIRPLQRYSPVLNYLLLTDGGEPKCYDEALQDENSSKWELAMKDEMDSLLGNQTWELTELLVGKKALHNKWVYRIKNEHDGSKRYKARSVVKGFYQKEGIDYTKIFSLVVKMSTIRLVLGMVAAENLHLEQLDVKQHSFMNLVCKLRKSLYGLKQALRQCTRSLTVLCIELGSRDVKMITGSNIEKINNLKKQLSKQFAMKDLGVAKQILGMRIIRDKANGTLKLSQSNYVKKVLSRFNMNEAKPVSTPLGSHFKLSKEQSPKTEEERDHMSKVPYASAIGNLMYAMVCTRLDIAHAMGVVSRFMSRPGKQHWEAVKWILRYLKGSLDTYFCFTGASLKL
ncbi:Retrovirus-related Pol polyprotein from transposon TNT 1-94 [Vitis vinifera]|uniref:Retrovirus-related Pol polyprotein from transposon TNT 1-94 n=1 Tax=Vitis vinifera TaxID=29760 RepID=A0A438CAK0_VITVI|nr:Retrovirus-related Pol polyprotein from transposon TNT 1-94 [Vitis vinifera]